MKYIHDGVHRGPDFCNPFLIIAVGESAVQHFAAPKLITPTKYPVENCLPSDVFLKGQVY